MIGQYLTGGDLNLMKTIWQIGRRSFLDVEFKIVEISLFIPHLVKRTAEAEGV